MNIQLMDDREEYILTHKTVLHSHPYQFQNEIRYVVKGLVFGSSSLINDSNEFKFKQ